MSNDLTTPKQRLLELFEGIFLGRTLHDLEKQAGAPIEELLKAVRDDEQAFLDFKANREWATYVQESELTTKLRENADNPESAVKTNALKLYADHMHWAMERANPAIFSGKVQVTANVPFQVVTTLDLNAAKRIDNVYDLTASVPVEKKLDEITDSEWKLLEDAAMSAPSPSPLDAAVETVLSSSSMEEAANRLDAIFSPDTGEREEQEPAASPQVAEATPRPKPRRKQEVVRSAAAPKKTRNSKKEAGA